MSELEDLNKLKVTELKAQLQSLGLDTKGVKAVLVERLREALEAKDGGSDIVSHTDENIDKPISEEDDEQQELEGQLLLLEKDEFEEEEEEKLKQVEEESKEEEEETVKEETKEEESKEEITKENGENNVGSHEIEDSIPVEDTEEPSVKHEDEEENSKKVDYEDAPMEDLELKQEYEDTQSNVKDEDIHSEIKAEQEEEDERIREEERRGTKRAHSDSHEDSKRQRPDVEEVRVEDEPEFDKNVVALDWYNSDLSLIIDKETRTSCIPMVTGGFAYLWHGVRASHGATKGKIYYEVNIEDNLDISGLEGEEEHPYVVRCGWSVDDSNLILGEEELSYGYGGTGKASTNLKFKDFGKVYGKGDVVGCFLDLDSEPIQMSFTVNGDNQGVCYEILRSELGESALFPHILTKNCSFKVNFGTEEKQFEPLTDFKFIGQVPIEELLLGTQGPEKRELCEVIMMIGLPAAGKTTWVENHCKENKEKRFNVLGTNNLIDRMKVMGLPRKRNYSGRWETLIDKCTKCLNKLLHLATKRRRNFIIDQTNVYPSAQKRKIKGFVGYKRRAVVIFPSDEDLKTRTETREKQEGKDVPDKAVLEMKANFKLPEVGEFFEEVDFVELQFEEASELLLLYNKEGEKAGFGPKNFYPDRNQQNKRVGYVDRRGKYNSRGGGGYRGGWDRDRDRRGGFDRRDRGGWNRDKDNRRDNYSRDRNSGGGFNRDRGHRGSGGGWQGNYKGHNQGKQGGGNWGSGQAGQQDYNNSWGGSQGYGGNQNWGGSQGYNPSNYNWNQQYYGQQQQAQTPYWNQGYGGGQSGYSGTASQTGYGNQGYGQGSYGYGQQQQQQQQPQPAATGQQQWGSGGYSAGYGTNNTGYGSQNAQSYTRNK